MDLRVMTFNIRNAIADDGLNSWQFRKRLLARAIQAQAPDILGLQEVYWIQREFLRAALPDYEQFGEHRKGGREGEAALICYRHTAFSLLEGGNVWLSDTPEVAGSRSWGNRNVRMASWARLRRRADGVRALFVNCHLDHESEEARTRSAALLARLVEQRSDGDPAILVGDFNAPPGSAPYRILTGAKGDPACTGPLFDAWHLAPTKPAHEGTIHDWEGEEEEARHPRIDWILVRPRLSVSCIRRPTYREGERLPSDHFPVVATIALKPQARS